MQKTRKEQVKKLMDEIPVSSISILARDRKSRQRQVQTRFSQEWKLEHISLPLHCISPTNHG